MSNRLGKSGGGTSQVFGMDSFGRVRVSDSVSQFDSATTADPANGADYTLLWDTANVTTGGTVANTWTNGYFANVLTKTSAAAVSSTRQTIRRFKYYPGKSNQIIMTFAMHTPTADLVQVVGQTDLVNGVFLRANGTTIEFVRIKGGVETVAAQSAWSVDKMDGTGPSGVTIDFTKSQILIFDYQWLGVGRIRCGFSVNGMIYYAHYFSFANTSSGVYTNSFHLPLRYSISAGAALANGTYTLQQICSTVQSEGGNSFEGIPRSTNSFVTAKTAASGTRTPVVSIRSRDPYTTIKLLGHHLVVTNAQDLLWEWWINPTLTDATWAATLGLASIDTAATAVADGTRIGSGYVKASSQGTNTSDENDIFQPPIAQLGRKLDGTYTHLTLVCTGVGGAATVLWAVNWKEIV